MTAAPALGSVLASELPEAETAAPVAWSQERAGWKVRAVPAVSIAVIVRDSSRAPPSPVSMLTVPPTW